MNTLNTNVPQDLRRVIGGEPTDFIVKAKRDRPRSVGMAGLIFGLFWTGFISIFWVVILTPLVMSGKVDFSADGKHVTATWDNMEPLLVPGLIIGLFTLIGLVMIIGGIRSLLRRGGWFAATRDRLLHYRKGTITSTDWEQFTGNTKVKSKGDLGNITFTLRTGKASGKNGFRHDEIYMAGVPNVFDIERKCQQRIKENDPTPAAGTEL